MGAEQTKHRILYEWLRMRIESGEYQTGQQIPTELELAEQFGYSRQTIRQAISTLEKEGLVQRIRGRGTFVCREGDESHPRTGTKRIGVLTTYLDDYIFPGIINGIEHVLTNGGYLFTLGLTHNKTLLETAALKKLLQAGIDGLILEGTKSALPTPNAGLLQQFRDMGVPVVFINGCYDETNSSYVMMDDVRSGMLLTELLLANGHTRIGGVFKSDDIQGIKRYEGVICRLQGSDAQLHDENILWYTTEDVDYYFGGQMDGLVLSRLEGTTAVVCYNDEIAAKLIETLRRMGKRVPEEISVVGFDDAPLAAPQFYNLTTVSYPAHEIGEKAAMVLLRAIEKPGYMEHIKIQPSVIERQTVRRLN